MTILFFTLVLGGLGLVDTAGNYAAAAIVVLGVFLGSGLWWLLLSRGASLFRSSLNPQRLVWINRLAGVVIFGFGLFMLLGIGR